MTIGDVKLKRSSMVDGRIFVDRSGEQCTLSQVFHRKSYINSSCKLIAIFGVLNKCCRGRRVDAADDSTRDAGTSESTHSNPYIGQYFSEF